MCDCDDMLDMLVRLVDKSLILADHAHRAARYHMLETIRQYAYDKLAAASEIDHTRARHLDYFVQFAEQAEPALAGPEALASLQQYAADHDNLRAALEWSRTAGGAQAGLRLAAACGRFWRLHGFLSEGRAQLLAALATARAAPPVDAAAEARAVYFAGSLAYLQSDYSAARAHFEDSLAVYEALGPPGRAGVADTLSMLGETATEEGDYAAANGLFERALALWRELGHTRGIADVLMQRGWSAQRTGNNDLAVQQLEESLGLFRQIGDAANLSFSLAGLGEVALRQGHYARARQLLEESLALRRQHGERWGMGTSLGSLGWLALRQGDYARMRADIGASLALRVETGDRGGIAWCLEKLAEAALLQAPAAAPAARAELRRAARLYGAAAALRAPVHSVIDPADQPEHERNLSALLAAMGQTAYEEAWAEGAALPLEQAIAQGLAEPQAPPTHTHAQAGPPGGLTPRERQVAALLAQGKSNREIAAALVVGSRTVETYISRILSKLGFTSRVQIATWAIEHEVTGPATDD